MSDWVKDNPVPDATLRKEYDTIKAQLGDKTILEIILEAQLFGPYLKQLVEDVAAAQLKALVVGKAVWIKNNVTGEQYWQPFTAEGQTTVFRVGTNAVVPSATARLLTK